MEQFDKWKFVEKCADFSAKLSSLQKDINEYYARFGREDEPNRPDMMKIYNQWKIDLGNLNLDEIRKSLIIKIHPDTLYWRVTRVPHDKHHMKYIMAVYKNKEDAEIFYCNGNGGYSDGVNWSYEMERVPFDGLSPHIQELIGLNGHYFI